MIESDAKKNTPLIEIEMFPAGHGDSLLVCAAMEDGAKINLLIDCGFVYTFQQKIRKRLTELARKGEYLNRLIITHIDADHINGALPLLENNGSSEAPKIIRIEQVWHNTFRHMQFDKKKTKLNFQEREVLNAITVSGFRKTTIGNSKEVEIGAEKGMALGALILKNNYSWNEDSFGKAICTDYQFQNKIHHKININILSPSKNKLEALKSNFVDEIENMGIGKITDDELFDDAFEYLTSRLEPVLSMENEASIDEINISELSDEEHFQEDKAPPNGSSIAFVLEIVNTRLLFLGDAHPSQIEMELNKLYPENTHTYPIMFDAIKVSHHGSNGNTSPELLRIIDSNKFLISTNGKIHRHPDKEIIARIVNRPTKDKRNLYFNYKTETSSAFDSPALKAEYNYEIIYPENCIKI